MGNAVFVVGYRIRCYYSEEGATGNGERATGKKERAREPN